MISTELQKRVIELSEYQLEWIRNAGRIPEDLNLELTNSILNGNFLEEEKDLEDER